MAHAFEPRFVDLVRNYTTTQGTSDLTLGVAVSGYSSIADVLNVGESFYYCLTHIDRPDEREVGRAILLAGGTVSRSPSGGVKTSFSPGTKTITLTVAAEWFEDAQQAVQQVVQQFLFTDIAHMRFASSVQRIQTGGRTVAGQSGAYYVRDPDQSLYTVPGQRLIDELNWSTGYVAAIVSKFRIQDADGTYWTIDDSSQEVDFGHFGGVADASYDPNIVNSVTGTENQEALQSYINWRQYILADTPGARRPILIRAGVYRVTGYIDIDRPDVLVLADGAVLVGEPMLYVNHQAHRCTVRGLTLVHNTADPANFLFKIYPSHFFLENCECKKEPETGGYIGYIQPTTSFGRIRGFTCSGSNGVYLGGHDHLIDGFDMTSIHGDDAWVIKAATGPSYNFVISNGIARNYSAVLSVGSEIGKFGANDPERTNFCRNIAVTNVIAQYCSTLMFIKPGAISQNDYRDGLVENVTMSNCVLEDVEGKQFRAAVHIAAGRGAIVRNVRFSNIAVRARVGSQAAASSGIYVLAVDLPGGSPIIEDVFIDGMSIIDPYGGVNGSDSVPGHPIDHAFMAEKSNDNVGTIGRLEVRNFNFSGCRRSAVAVGPGVTGPLMMRGVSLRNYAAAILASYDRAAILTHSKIDLRDFEARPSSASPQARGVMSDGQPDKSAEIVGEVALLPMDDVISGNINRVFWTPPRDSWIRKIELVSWSSVSQSDTDYAVFEVRNLSNSSILTSLTTRTAAAGGTAITASQKFSLGGVNQFSGDTAYLPAGAMLMFSWSHVGTGRAVQNPTFVIHYVPYGQA